MEELQDIFPQTSMETSKKDPLRVRIAKRLSWRLR